ncbi:MAG: DoxX family protein [Oscillochloris sp.]|nr:DoxX family protein [Oscillochloris sp.]
MRSINPGYGVTLLRIVTGIIFLAHGLQKLFMFGIPGTTGFLSSLGIPAAGLAAPLLIAVEVVGGLALILGLFTRYAGIILALNMLVALLTAHLSKGFFAADGGFEFVLMLGAASLALSFLGSGALALDTILPKRASSAARVAQRA